MASGGWSSSARRSTLPPGWPKIRQQVFKRDGRECQIQGPGCIGTASDVDHIGAPDDHRLESLRSACRPCHSTRSGQQGGRASGARSHARAQSRKRPVERHPGTY